MSINPRLLRIRKKLIALNHRATEMSQVIDDEIIKYAARVDANLSLLSLEHALETIQKFNSAIMGNLSTNQKLMKLREENEKLRAQLESLQPDDEDKAPEPEADAPEAAADTADDSAAQPEESADALDVEQNAAPLRKEIRAVEDIGVLSATLEAEQNNKNRKSVVELLDEKIAELRNAEG